MIELKISGETMQHVFNDAAQVLALLVAGAQAGQTKQQVATDIKEMTEKVILENIAEPQANPSPSAAPVAKKPGRPKKPEIVEVQPEQLDIENATPVEITDDEMRQRVKDIVAKHTERGNEMPHCINYVKELFLPFAVKNAVQIPANRRAEFMTASLAYLEGTA